ncbi:MAG: methyltransferase domain-containing protein [Cyanobacteriota bacterium]|nr:methyltransferase domain-containing protein [Cyanobacteriota bacterium]
MGRGFGKNLPQRQSPQRRRDPVAAAPSNQELVGETLAPYVRSLPMVIEAMLDLAEVSAADCLYDLGCGDGRIVIAAARRGAKAVGIERDPKLIEIAQAEAVQAGVAEQVSFWQADLRTVDLSVATVVTLYLLPRTQLALRERLRSQLRPGSRIVTHSFDLGDWLPTRTTGVADVINTYPIYLWQL